MPRVVLAYSGGLKTSVAIPWLAENCRAEVVTVTVDLGQANELDDVRERALSSGAVRAHVIDAREEFVRDMILPALQASAIYEGGSPLATALGRPLIARHLVEIARIEGASEVAHGCPPSGNDSIRLDAAVRALDPSLRVIAPASMWDLTRAQAVAYARQRGIPVPASVDSPVSVDANLWGRSIMGGAIDDPWVEPAEDLYTLTKPPAEAPDTPAYVEIEFERGVPVGINGVTMSLLELIQSLGTIAGAHGVGRVDMVENRLAGVKTREVYESPAAAALHVAHKALQVYVTPRDLDRVTTDLGVKYADLVYSGQWYTPAREAIDALIARVQETVTGTVRLKCFKGDCRVVGRRSPFGLYELAQAEAGVEVE